MKPALPWFGSIAAAVLLFTPTYGIGLVIAPLTLICSWIALTPVAGASRASRIGATINVVLVVGGLSLLMVIWVPVGLVYFVLAWALVVVIALLVYTGERQHRSQRLSLR